jgi:putative acetyltransferase
MLQLREYRCGDEAALAALYRDAVHNICCDAYDARQVQAWAAYADEERFRHQLRLGLTLMAVCGARIAAFAQLHPADHVALLYTAAAFARHGYATRLYAALEARASAAGTQRLLTEASRIARHFFLKMGFRVIEPQVVERHGVAFERFRMEKQIA